jgi:hypothetical protein
MIFVLCFLKALSVIHHRTKYRTARVARTKRPTLTERNRGALVESIESVVRQEIGEVIAH